ncbi:hypothetical protein MXL46_13755 [Heyndrickxia sporothermodurans]|uniref:hypothetical protein n=1 Tax=Heyndrickxia sporothermodurans TaxID=46224 RepID=UPI000D35584F|nr:hypothetical protein [Heyndrickxia sporothermodurans]MBL5769013.1 hypothetical protein [Heyndrickxia sporothermodurans]MBL5772800.1 hypothetical protein [Heyndrickxia sporothermodurans]MBL5783366.1 hypothetical protein [Heyndrickxia sporothermodurans]MBL5786888.1 hypothetical protein [Heyndrickxia sporothermodurans]MBL5790505.1 hypothetical protein [Heyndrickxia sporothermodurans]
MYNTNNNLKSIEYILHYFPSLKLYLEKTSSNENIPLLNDVEKTFLEMCLFFENPSKHSFDFRLVYLHLQDEWVIVALKALELFTRKDTYMIKTFGESFIKPEETSYKYN